MALFFTTVQGIVLAIVVSILEVIRRHYKPKDFVVSVSPTGDESYATGADSGLVDTLGAYDLLDRIGADHLHGTLSEALDAFRRDDSTRL